MHKSSVIIPYFNNENTVLQALKSVVHQSRPPEEIILIDDGSTQHPNQDTLTWCEQHGVIYHRTSNLGAAKARNFAANLASGDVLYFLDADDLWDPDLIKVVSTVFEFSATDLVGYRYQWISETGRKLKFVSKFYRNVDLRLLAWKSPWGICFATKKAPFLQAGGFDSSLVIGEEQSCQVRMLMQGCHFTSLPDILYLYRKTSGSLTHSKFLYLQNLFSTYCNYFRIFPKTWIPFLFLALLRNLLVPFLLPLRKFLLALPIKKLGE